MSKPPVVIEYGDNVCRVLSGPVPLVRGACSVEDPRAVFSPAYKLGHWDGVFHFYDWRTKTFPTGMLAKVKKAAEAKGIGVSVKGTPQRPPLDASKVRDDMLFGITLRPHQVNAVRTAVMRERGCLAIATNGGKTEVIAAIAATVRDQTNAVCLVVVPTKLLMTQTANRLRLRLGNTASVGIVGGGSRDTDADVVVGTFQTLRKGCTATGPLATLLRRVNCVFIDEGHRTSNATIQMILKACPARFRFALSGSFRGHDVLKETAIRAYTGPVIVRVSNKYLMSKGYSATAVVSLVTDDRVYSRDHTAPKMVRVVEHGQVVLRSVDPLDRASQEVNALLSDRDYNRWIVRVTDALDAAGFKPLVLSTSLDHLRTLETLIASDTGLTPLLVTGKVPLSLREDRLRLFSNRPRMVLLGSSVLDEGVDCPQIGAILLVSGGKSIQKTLQRVGRAVRAKSEGLNAVLVVDFAAGNGAYIAAHSLERLQVYEDESFEVVEVRDVQGWLERLTQGWPGAIGTDLYDRLLKKQTERLGKASRSAPARSIGASTGGSTPAG